MKKKIFTTIVALLSLILGAQAQNLANGHEYVDLGLPSGTLWATEDAMSVTISNIPHVSSTHIGWGAQWILPTESQIRELYENCTRKVVDDEYTFVSKINGKSIKIFRTYTNYEGTITRTYYYPIVGLRKEEWGTHTTSYYPSYLSGSIYQGYDTGADIAFIRPIIDGERIKDGKICNVISNIPDGWKVNGETPTDGKVFVAPDEAVTVTPDNIPLGKKIKSIKLVPTE
jgi:hypothetical protein